MDFGLRPNRIFFEFWSLQIRFKKTKSLTLHFVLCLDLNRVGWKQEIRMDFGLDSQTGLPFTVDLHGFSERALGQKGNMGRDFIDVSRQDLLHNCVQYK